MRKILVIVILVVSTTFAFAYEVGDWFYDPQTGIPSVVIYVDETGEHGLIMAPCGGYSTEKSITSDIKSIRNNKKKYEKMNLKMAKSQMKKLGVDISHVDDYVAQADVLFDAVIAWLPSMPLMHRTGITEKQERRMLRNVAAKMTGNGLQDQQMIIDFSEENDVNLPEYFSSIDWAQKLGNGWFIPGNYELELFASSISKGLGVHMNEIEAFETGIMFAYKTWMLSTVFPKKIRSSTFLESPWETIGNNKAKTATIVMRDFDFKDNYYVLGTGNNLGDIFNVLVKNNQYMSYTVAFKYF